MEYFNLNSFLLGSLLLGFFLLAIIVYCIVCFIWDVKILIFGIFDSPRFSLHDEKVLGTRFIFGWLPLSCYMGALGSNTDEKDKNKISESDLPYALFNKPKYVQTLFHLSPKIVYLFGFLIAILLLNETSVINEIGKIIYYLEQAFKTMFSNNSTEINQFVALTKEITNGEHKFLFAFTILILMVILFKTLFWFINLEYEKKKPFKFLWLPTAILFLWFILWKIPKFIFSFFSMTQMFIYFYSFLIGMFVTGLICFFTTLYVVKGVSKNISESKLQ